MARRLSSCCHPMVDVATGFDPDGAVFTSARLSTNL